MYRVCFNTIMFMVLLYVCMQGKVEVEFEILTEAEAKLRPAAKARDKPNQNPVLPEPK